MEPVKGKLSCRTQVRDHISSPHCEGPQAKALQALWPINCAMEGGLRTHTQNAMHVSVCIFYAADIPHRFNSE